MCIWQYHRTGTGCKEMLGVVISAMVIVAIAIIVGSVIWGWRNGALWESDQERFDRRFHEIISG